MKVIRLCELCQQVHGHSWYILVSSSMQRPSPWQPLYTTVGQNWQAMATYLSEYFIPCSEEEERLPMGRILLQ